MSILLPSTCIALCIVMPIVSPVMCDSPFFEPRPIFKLFCCPEDYTAGINLLEAQVALIIIYGVADGYHVLPFEFGTPYVMCIPLIMWIAWMFFPSKEVE